jgi:hypothetical protein
MKKYVLLLGVVLCLAGTSALAQRAQLGIKGGLNISNLSHDWDWDADAKVGAHAGLLIHIPMDRPLALQPEVVFSMQGAEYGDRDVELNYLNVPFLFMYKFPEGFRLETGPQVGVLLSAEQDDNDFIERDIEHRMKKTDLGWAFGLGYLSRTGLGVDLRYNLGLTEIYKPGYPNDVTNQVWQIGLFYQFR